MKIRVGYELGFECAQPTAMLLMLNIHYSRASDLLAPDLLKITPSVPVDMYLDLFCNWVTRILAPAGIPRIPSDALVNDSGLPDRVLPAARQIPVSSLPHDTLVF